MEINSANDELLIGYLANELTVGEKDHVENWLNASEENRQHFKTLKRAWQLSGEEKALNHVIDDLNVDEKWIQIRQAIGEKGAKVFPINDELKTSGDNYEQQQSQKPGIYRLLLRVAIAASVLLILGMGWMYFMSNNQNKQVAKDQVKKSDSLVTVLRHEVNTTGKDKRLEMPDGSLIVLANKAEITYREPFIKERNITLVGKAFFKVAKDTIKPFTVFSGDISTTALGTEFTVTTSLKNNRVIVRLYEGKVVVKAVDKNNKKLNNAIYLKPGQSYVYGGMELVKLKEFKIEKVDIPEQIIRQELPLDNPSIPENTKGSYFMFNNQSLDEVFDNLAALYNVDIHYNKNDIKNLYLIGKYNSSDSLKTILQRIATLNDLTVIKKDDAFFIAR